MSASGVSFTYIDAGDRIVCSRSERCAGRELWASFTSRPGGKSWRGFNGRRARRMDAREVDEFRAFLRPECPADASVCECERRGV